MEKKQLRNIKGVFSTSDDKIFFPFDIRNYNLSGLYLN